MAEPHMMSWNWAKAVGFQASVKLDVGYGCPCMAASEEKTSPAYKLFSLDRTAFFRSAWVV